MIFFLGAILCLALSLLQFHDTNILQLWKLSIFTTEMGQWLALGILVLVPLRLKLAPRRKLQQMAVVVLALSFILFLIASF